MLARGPGAAPYHGYMRREAARAGEAVEGLQVTAGEAVGWWQGSAEIVEPHESQAGR